MEQTPDLDSVVRMYDYNSLDNASDDIRLLELNPGRHDEPLRCALTITRLSIIPSYKALSYAWGDHKATENIFCNEYNLVITSSLAVSLRQLRHESEAQVLWADAICINQKDVRERENQVRLMADIYRQAQEVLVWLGPDINGTAELAFDLIAEYTKFVRNELKRLPSSSEHMPFAKIPAFYPNGPVEVDHDGLRAIADAFDRPWFKRVWVLQEVGLAAYAKVLYGTSAIPFENLVCFAQAICNTSPSLGYQLHTWAVRYSHIDIWSTYECSPSWQDRLPFKFALRTQCRLADVLYTSCSRRASEERDYIYSMLGHPAFKDKETSSPLFQPDYIIGFDELCYRVTAAILQQTGDLSILSLVRHDQTNELSRKVSWIPNYGHIPVRIDYQMFSASKAAPAGTRIDGNKLYCQGIVIDTVTSNFDPYYGQNTHHGGPDEAELVESLNKLWNCIREKDPTMRYQTLDPMQSLACVLTCKSFEIEENWSTLTGRDRDVASTTEGLRRCLLPTRSMAQIPQRGSVLSIVDKNMISHDEPENSKAANFLHRTRHVYPNRRFFTTQTGYWGLGPAIMQPEDMCCVLYDARVPYILRPWGEEGYYKLIGECYVLELMEGQALAMLEKEQVKKEWFTIC
jgi:hypothetical protein